MKTKLNTHIITRPINLLQIPVPPPHSLDGVDLELNNIYGYIVWLRNRVEQLEEAIDPSLIEKRKMGLTRGTNLV